VKWNKDIRANRAAKRAIRLADASLAKDESRTRLKYRLKVSYGMTTDDYDRMFESQEGLCAICGMSPVGRGRSDMLVVDHCHTKGNVRALLCGNCNSALGLLDDSPVILQSAMDYIKKWSDPLLA
jgi:hypothetical protein